MLAPERRRLIVQWLQEQGSLKAEDLQRRLDVSRMTIRRDLEALEAKGLLRRVHGGAVPPNAAEEHKPASSLPLLEGRATLNAGRIAHYVARYLIADSETIALDGSAPCRALTGELGGFENLAIVTSDLRILNELLHRGDRMTVLGTGGVLAAATGGFVGSQAEGFFRSIRLRQAFIGAAGFSAHGQLSDPHPLSIQVKRAMAAAAQRRILLLESEAWDHEALAPLLPLERFDLVVTDADAPPAMLELLNERRIEFAVAD